MRLCDCVYSYVLVWLAGSCQPEELTSTVKVARQNLPHAKVLCECNHHHVSVAALRKLFVCLIRISAPAVQPPLSFAPPSGFYFNVVKVEAAAYRWQPGIVSEHSLQSRAYHSSRGSYVRDGWKNHVSYAGC